MRIALYVATILGVVNAGLLYKDGMSHDDHIADTKWYIEGLKGFYSGYSNAFYRTHKTANQDKCFDDETINNIVVYTELVDDISTMFDDITDIQKDFSMTASRLRRNAEIMTALTVTTMSRWHTNAQSPSQTLTRIHCHRPHLNGPPKFSSESLEFTVVCTSRSSRETCEEGRIGPKLSAIGFVSRSAKNESKERLRESLRNFSEILTRQKPRMKLRAELVCVALLRFT